MRAFSLTVFLTIITIIASPFANASEESLEGFGRRCLMTPSNTSKALTDVSLSADKLKLMLKKPQEFKGEGGDIYTIQMQPSKTGSEKALNAFITEVSNSIMDINMPVSLVPNFRASMFLSAVQEAGSAGTKTELPWNLTHPTAWSKYSVNIIITKK